MTDQPTPTKAELHDARWELLEHINRLTENLMIALAFVWLGLLIIDFTNGLSPLLQTVSNVIWAAFIVDFVIEFIIAPDKGRYLRRNWLTAVSLVLPALRILRIFRAFRVFRAVRAVRTVGFLRLITSLNRGMRATARTLGKRSIGYVIALTILVVFGGAAGMAYFESPTALEASGYNEAVETNLGLESYSEAVWWTSMLMTTLGSDYWPLTVEGRILCWVLSLYALAVFGYITAAFASYFVGLDREEETPLPPDDVTALREQLIAMQRQMGALSQQLEASAEGE